VFDRTIVQCSISKYRNTSETNIGIQMTLWMWQFYYYDYYY